jgi:KDO2-lipid IV(A) lauroyltransferase
VPALRLRQRLEYAVVAGIRGVLRPLSMKAVLAGGTTLGYLFYVLDRAHRRLALANLDAAFPQRPPPERRAIAREMFAHFGRLLMVLLKFSTMTPEQMLAHVEFEGDDRVRAAHAHGRGVLLFTGHFGYWEINALVHALVLAPIAVVARPLDNPMLHELLEHVRSMTGNSVIYRKGGLRRILRALSANEAVALLIDQHIHTNAVYVEFFNRPAATTTALAALAARTGAPVIPVFALPLSDGRFRMVYEHAVDPPRGADESSLREFTQRCTDVLEMYVRRYPDLWLWMHRRWRDVDSADREVPGMFPTARPEEDSE